MTATVVHDPLIQDPPAEPEPEDFEIMIEVYVEWDAGDPADIDPGDYANPAFVPRVLSRDELARRVYDSSLDDLSFGYEIAPGYTATIWGTSVC